MHGLNLAIKSKTYFIYEPSSTKPKLYHIRPPWNAGYKANAAGKKVSFSYYSAFAAE